MSDFSDRSLLFVHYHDGVEFIVEKLGIYRVFQEE
jgi:hypothetical protein